MRLKVLLTVILFVFIFSCGENPFEENELLATVAREEFGPIFWNVIHTNAASLSNVATQEEKKALEDFFNGIRYHFPCQECRCHFRNMTDFIPPVVTGKKETSQYTCELHNIVNERLGHDIFDCSIFNDFYGSE